MTQPQARKLTLVLLAFALGGALRLWFIHHAAVLTGDTLLYGDIALSWMQHGIYGFSQPPLAPVPTLIRLPGYPLFLMLCFRLFGPEHYTAVLNLQCVLDLLACLSAERARPPPLWHSRRPHRTLSQRSLPLHGQLRRRRSYRDAHVRDDRRRLLRPQSLAF